MNIILQHSLVERAGTLDQNRVCLNSRSATYKMLLTQLLRASDSIICKDTRGMNYMHRQQVWCTIHSNEYEESIIGILKITTGGYYCYSKITCSLER